MQESILPSKGQIWCGSWHFTDMETFSTVGVEIGLYFGKLGLDSPEHTSLSAASDYLSDFLFARHNDPDCIGGVREVLTHYKTEPLRFLSGEASIHVIDCLRASRGKRCSKVHDVIYGTFGLHHENLVEVSYEMPKKELFISVALHPSVICYALEEAGLDSRRSNCTDDLPSWVPDWSLRLSAEPWTRHRRFLSYQSGGGNFQNFSMTRLPGDVVQVAGLCEDEVAFLGGDGTPPIGIESLLTSLELLHDISRQPGHTLDVKRLVRRLAKTLVINLGTSYKPPYSSFSDIAQDFRAYLHQGFMQLSTRVSREEYEKEIDKLAFLLKISRDHLYAPNMKKLKNRKSLHWTKLSTTQYTGLLAKHFHMRRFFVTKKGRMGIASHITEVGDVIMVLKNCEFPFMMRKGTEGRWKLISQAYVEDIMHGEALEGREFEDILIE